MRWVGLMIASLVAAGVSAGAAAAQQQQQAIGQDLTATIVLHGQPCDKVIDSKRNGDSDYVATCQNGRRYHVFVDTAGRVVVQKL